MFKLGEYLVTFPRNKTEHYFLAGTEVRKSEILSSRWHVWRSKNTDRVLSVHLQVLRDKLSTQRLFCCYFLLRASLKKPKNIYQRFALLNGKVSVQVIGMTMQCISCFNFSFCIQELSPNKLSESSWMVNDFWLRC